MLFGEWDGGNTVGENRVAEKLFYRPGEIMVTWTGMVAVEMERST